MRLLGISGSLRSGSSNTALLQAAALLAPVGMEITLYTHLDELPHFNPTSLARNLDAATIAADAALTTPLREALVAFARTQDVPPGRPLLR